MRDRSLPRLVLVDSTLSFLREGYDFVSRRCDRLGTDGFRTRIMLRPVTCLRGPAAAQAFYVPGRLSRRGAMPGGVLALLQDKGSVQTLDGVAHRCRRLLFLSLMADERLRMARQMLREEWQAASSGWRAREIVLADEVGPILTRVALRWCGIDPAENAPQRRCEELTAMISCAARIGPGHLRARALRRRAEAWAREQIRAARSGAPDPGTPLDRVARHRGPDGIALPRAVAAIELLNLLRPIVAVGRYIVFSAHAMVNHPEARVALVSDESGLRAWGDEVRRLYPFFPVIGGRVIEPFSHEGHRFAPGDWLLLDLYGSNRHPAAWSEAGRFEPRRHLGAPATTGGFVPQGGGSMRIGHRCPGEALTAALLSEATALLLESGFDAPPQDLSIPRTAIPPWPASGLRLWL